MSFTGLSNHLHHRSFLFLLYKYIRELQQCAAAVCYTHYISIFCQHERSAATQKDDQQNIMCSSLSASLFPLLEKVARLPSASKNNIERLYSLVCVGVLCSTDKPVWCQRSFHLGHSREERSQRTEVSSPGLWVRRRAWTCFSLYLRQMVVCRYPVTSAWQDVH